MKRERKKNNLNFLSVVVVIVNYVYNVIEKVLVGIAS